ncbi:MAG: hypothetical protein HY961_00095 [Ignavibacteriae bacterium]|nr:hypothetical protein [Ignavibacteriota bacterium]
MTHLKQVGSSTELYTRPLTRALQANTAVRLLEDSRPRIATLLREGELKLGLISPLDYAKESSDYRIIPNVGVAAERSCGSLLVRFREGVKNIRSLAVDPTYASEVVLAKIILSELFDLEPMILPMNAPVEVMLQKAEAALLVGNAAFRARDDSEDVIDIVEEWDEMTGLPCVFGLWCGREPDLKPEYIEMIQHAMQKGVAGIADIAQEFLPDERAAVIDYLESFAYTLDERATAGLGEYMKYLYYHGLLPDVAELNFYKGTAEEADDLLPKDVSPN